MACQVQSEALPSFASLAAEPAVEHPDPDAAVATTLGSLSKPLVLNNGVMTALSTQHSARHWSARAYLSLASCDREFRLISDFSEAEKDHANVTVTTISTISS